MSATQDLTVFCVGEPGSVLLTRVLDILSHTTRRAVARRTEAAARHQGIENSPLVINSPQYSLNKLPNKLPLSRGIQHIPFLRWDLPCGARQLRRLAAARPSTAAQCHATALSLNKISANGPLQAGAP